VNPDDGKELAKAQREGQAHSGYLTSAWDMFQCGALLFMMLGLTLI